jgi:hypothetical protein
MAAALGPAVIDLAKDRNVQEVLMNASSSIVGVVPMLLIGSIGFIVFCIGLIVFSVSSSKTTGVLIIMAGMGIGAVGVGVYMLPQFMNSRRQNYNALAGNIHLQQQVPQQARAVQQLPPIIVQRPIQTPAVSVPYDRGVDANGKLLPSPPPKDEVLKLPPPPPPEQLKGSQPPLIANKLGGDFTDNLANTFRPAVNAFGNTSFGQKISNGLGTFNPTKYMGGYLF